ncbi:MAG: hypothetical protein P8Q35_03195 [Candidatus Thalassarchaeaceae archaeon]|jgi:hypothetical protein|nr:hypothetical protein [Candidatus Thalassarchaeaceae archaeon]
MTSQPNDKVEVKVVVESKDTSSKVILIILILVLSGLTIAVIAKGGPEALLSGDDGRGVGNCGDGIDNDKGGQADRDDPDCYANPSVWEGYDPNRTEANRDNDPPGGQP